MNKSFLFIFTAMLFANLALSQWTIQYTPGQSQSSYTMKFYNENTGYYSGVLYNGSTFNIYKTTNGGMNFVAQNSNFTSQRYMSIFMMHPDTVFISGNYGKILRTVNGGNNWITIYSDTTKQFWGLFFTSSNTGYVAGSAGTIMKTTNKGDNWSVLTTPTMTSLDGIWFVNENTGYVGGANVFLKTTDAGLTWVNKVGNFISPFETAQAVYFSDANTGYYCTNTSNCRIVKTTDGGDTWALIHTNEGIGAGWDMSFTDANTGYICTGAGKVLKTTNAGLNWGVQNTPLTENLYTIHFPSAATGYITTWSGKVLKTTNGGATFLTEEKSTTPDKYELFQNFPNPFNPVTTIRWQMLNSANAKIAVYDINGKEVSVIVNQKLQPGTYSVTFNANGISSGVYYYKLTAGSYSAVKKMIIVK